MQAGLCTEIPVTKEQIVVPCALKFNADTTDDGSVTNRRSDLSRFGHVVASTVLILAAIGLTSSARADVTEVRQSPVPVTASIATDIVTLVALVPEDASPVAAAPAETDPPVIPVERAPQPAPNPCADALAWVAETGLTLPTAVEYHCPSTQFAHQGAACFGNRTYCPGRGFIAINMALLEGTSTGYLRHVVAHEVCHILDFQRTGSTTETGADACAAAHGAPK